jgi:hypothetical protein
MGAMLLLRISCEKHRVHGRSYKLAGSRTAALRGVHNAQPGR